MIDLALIIMWQPLKSSHLPGSKNVYDLVLNLVFEISASFIFINTSVLIFRVWLVYNIVMPKFLLVLLIIIGHML